MKTNGFMCIIKNLKFYFYITMFISASQPVFSDPIAGVPSPGERILIISTSAAPDTFNQQVVTNIKAALNAMAIPPSLIDEVIIPSDDVNGFYDNLGGKNLNDYCEVWDVRIVGDHNLIYSGVIREDSITSVGATSDRQLFYDFLNNGGHLYLQGENYGYFARNEPLNAFINYITGQPIGLPIVDVVHPNLTTFASAPENFNTDFNSLAGVIINTNYPGGVPLPLVGAGRPVLTGVLSDSQPVYTAGPVNCAIGLAYLPADLITGNGKMFVNFEASSFATGIYDLANEGKYIQNIYDYLASCYYYTVTKTISDNNICVGETTVYTICYTNTGTKALPAATMWDTVPSCLAITGYSGAPVVSGNYILWNIGVVNPGASACQTITVRANQLPPCP
jgi:uncharacterized repeat protein (TIGR01451 family)